MPQIIPLPAAIPSDVQQYAVAHNLLSDLHLAMQWAEEMFSPIDRCEITLETDPETDELSIAIDIWLSMTIEETVKRNHDFALRWASGAKHESQLVIRLLTHLI